MNTAKMLLHIDNMLNENELAIQEITPEIRDKLIDMFGTTHLRILLNTKNTLQSMRVKLLKYKKRIIKINKQEEK